MGNAHVLYVRGQRLGSHKLRVIGASPPGHYFRINVKSTIYLFVLNIVRMFLNFVSMMVDWILNTHFAVEKVDVANGREHPHY